MSITHQRRTHRFHINMYQISVVSDENRLLVTGGLDAIVTKMNLRLKHLSLSMSYFHLPTLHTNDSPRRLNNE